MRLERSGRRHGIVTFLMAFAAVGLLLGATACDQGQQTTGSWVLVNHERSARGLPALRWDEQLAAKARVWAGRMADTNVLQHSNLAEGVTSWRTLGENVGYGGDVEDIHRRFMASAAHRAAILNGQFNSVGIGVVQRDGRVWVSEVFKS